MSSLVVPVCPLVVLVCPLVLLVCSFVVLVCPLVLSVCQLVVLVVLSVGLFITDHEIISYSQLVEYNMRNIFLEKSYTKWGRETIPRPFSKNLKLYISVDQKSKVLYSLFLLYQVEGYRNILKLSCRILFYQI